MLLMIKKTRQNSLFKTSILTRDSVVENYIPSPSQCQVPSFRTAADETVIFPIGKLSSQSLIMVRELKTVDQPFRV